MLNGLILAVLGLLVLLIAIKYGVLQVLAIALSLIALIPFGTSVYLYFINRPVITYQLASKSRKKEGNKFIYQAWLGVHAEKGQVLLDGVYIAEHEPGLSMVVPGDASIPRMAMLEESKFRSAMRLDSGTKPFFTKAGYIYTLRFESESEKPRFPLELIVDTKVDPAKLGFVSIFQPGYAYRFTTSIDVDFVNLDRQEGELKPTY